MIISIWFKTIAPGVLLAALAAARPARADDPPGPDAGPREREAIARALAESYPDRPE